MLQLRLALGLGLGLRFGLGLDMLEEREERGPHDGEKAEALC